MPFNTGFNTPSISFKVRMPEKGFLLDLFTAQVQSALRNDVKPELREMFYRTTSTWHTKVFFRGTIRTEKGKYIRLLVMPYGSGSALYNMLARGTRPHEIVPVNAPALKFRPGYTPATSPGWIGSRQARSSGPMQSRQHVWHPGAEARNWDIEIAKQYEPRFIGHMKKATKFYVAKQAAAFAKSLLSKKPRPVKRQ